MKVKIVEETICEYLETAINGALLPYSDDEVEEVKIVRGHENSYLGLIVLKS